MLWQVDAEVSTDLPPPIRHGSQDGEETAERRFNDRLPNQQ